MRSSAVSLALATPQDGSAQEPRYTKGCAPWFRSRFIVLTFPQDRADPSQLSDLRFLAAEPLGVENAPFTQPRHPDCPEKVSAQPVDATQARRSCRCKRRGLAQKGVFKGCSGWGETPCVSSPRRHKRAASVKSARPFSRLLPRRSRRRCRIKATISANYCARKSGHCKPNSPSCRRSSANCAKSSPASMPEFSICRRCRWPGG
jgi:hypothetical protein